MGLFRLKQQQLPLITNPNAAISQVDKLQISPIIHQRERRKEIFNYSAAFIV